MRFGFLEEIPQFPIDVYNTVQKPGSRIEYSLKLSDELIQLGNKISSLPLKFASLVKAFPSSDGQHQRFHADSQDGERAIVYLTNVDEESNGPIEFLESGKLLGKAGTFAHYSANEIHRGCASDIERYALALAFDTTSKAITTVGVNPCFGIECPPGFVEKVDIPSQPPYDETTCCEFSGAPPSENEKTIWNTIIFVLIIVAASLVSLYFLNRYLEKKKINFSKIGRSHV
jgi:hypothetical protein